jgi:hypothetical protein
VVLRAPGQSALHIVVNAPGERLRFRYLHMSPQQLDRNEVINGHAVREGEVIGQVGNYLKREGATTYHLHFDIQVPTRYGWVFVNPYMTLVSAYERLIGGHGEEVKDPPKEEIKEEIKPADVGLAAVPPPSPAPSETIPAAAATVPSETVPAALVPAETVAAPAVPVTAAVNPVGIAVQSEARERIAVETAPDEATQQSKLP